MYLKVAGAEVDDGNDKDGSHWHNNTPHWIQPCAPHHGLSVRRGDDKLTTLIICPALLQECTVSFSLLYKLWLARYSLYAPPRFTQHCARVCAVINNCGSFDWQNRRQTLCRHANLPLRSQHLKEADRAKSRCGCGCVSVNARYVLGECRGFVEKTNATCVSRRFSYVWVYLWVCVRICVNMHVFVFSSTVCMCGTERLWQKLQHELKTKGNILICSSHTLYCEWWSHDDTVKTAVHINSFSTH